MDQAEALYLKQQRDGLLMQVAAIERRLGVASGARCPQCDTTFAVRDKQKCLIVQRTDETPQPQPV